MGISLGRKLTRATFSALLTQATSSRKATSNASRKPSGRMIKRLRAAMTRMINVRQRPKRAARLQAALLAQPLSRTRQLVRNAKLEASQSADRPFEATFNDVSAVVGTPHTCNARRPVVERQKIR